MPREKRIYSYGLSIRATTSPPAVAPASPRAPTPPGVSLLPGPRLLCRCASRLFVHHQHNVLVLARSHLLLGELLIKRHREQLHINRGQDQPVDLSTLGPHEAIQVGPLIVAPLDPPWLWASSSFPPAAPTPALSPALGPEPGLILGPKSSTPWPSDRPPGASPASPEDFFESFPFSGVGPRALLEAWGPGGCISHLLLRYSQPRRASCTPSCPPPSSVRSSAPPSPRPAPPHPSARRRGPSSASRSSARPSSSSTTPSL